MTVVVATQGQKGSQLGPNNPRKLYAAVGTALMNEPVA
jgi:hypothetical protein